MILALQAMMHSGQDSFDGAIRHDYCSAVEDHGPSSYHAYQRIASPTRPGIPSLPWAWSEGGVFEMSPLPPTSYRCYRFTGGGGGLTSIWTASMFGGCKQLPCMCYVDAIT
jgi:hypothetical protein